jgi:hypothetical protein
VAVRFNLFMTEAQHRCLMREANRTGLAAAELVRRAIDSAYRPEVRPRVDGIEVSLGLWRRPDAAVARRRRGRRLLD